jgi:4,5-dihydroxyphthalate decarboxylase
MAMTDSRPRIAVARYDRTIPLILSEVEGCDRFDFHEGGTMDITRGLLDGEIVAGEMSFSAFVKARETGMPLRALPIFTNRKFFQQYIYVARDSDIRSIADLGGRRVGVYMYWMTSSVWHRQYLAAEAGIEASDLEWVALMNARLDSMKIPAGVNFESLGRSRPQGIAELLTDGRVDCILGAASTPEILEARDRIERPFDDLDQAQRDYFERTGIFPIVHLVVCRESFLENREEVEDLCGAFEAAKQAAYQKLEDETYTSLPFIRSYVDDSRSVFGSDPYQDGLEANRHILEAFLESSHRQGLTERRLGVEELF